jgi:hypothetical protein
MSYGMQCIGADRNVTLDENQIYYKYLGKFTAEGRDWGNDATPDFWAVTKNYTHHVKIPKVAGETIRPMAFCDVPYSAGAGISTSEYHAGASVVAVLDGDLETTEALWTSGLWIVILAARLHTPTVRIFRLWNQAASGEAYGLRVWDQSGALKFDSGHRYLWIKDYGSVSLSPMYLSGVSSVEPSNSFPVHLAGKSVSLTTSGGGSKAWNAGNGPSGGSYGNARYLSKMCAHNGTASYFDWRYTAGAIGGVSSYRHSLALTAQTSIEYMTIDNAAFP